MDHESVIVYCSSYFIEDEILWKDNRARKISIITFFHEHSFCIQIERRMFPFSRNGEDISRESDIDERWIHSGYRSNDDEFFREIEDIDRYLPDISIMVAFFTDLDIDLVIIMICCRFMSVIMLIVVNWLSFFCVCCANTEEFCHKKKQEIG